MNDEQHAFWLGYIRQLADLLGLKDWRIELDRDPTNREGAGASNYTYYGRKKADITFGPSFLVQSPEDQRYILAHECLHCHFDHIHKGVIAYAESKGDGDESYFAQAHLRDFENIVDTVAVIVAPFLPLPGSADHETFADIDPSDLRFVTFADPSPVKLPGFVVPTETFNGADR